MTHVFLRATRQERLHALQFVLSAFVSKSPSQATSPKELPLPHTSHKSNPRPCLRVTWRSVPYVTWVAGTGVEVYYDTRCLMGLWYTQAKVEGIVLKATWYWGSNCSAVNHPLGQPVTTPLYVGLPSARCFVDGERMFSLLLRGKAPWLGTPRIRMNE